MMNRYHILHTLFQPIITTAFELGNIIPVSQMKKQRLNEFNYLAQVVEIELSDSVI